MNSSHLHQEGHLADDSVPMIKDVIKIVCPQSIFEIGYYEGHSARMWLTYSMASLFSIDINRHDSSIIELEREFTGRFEFRQADSKQIFPKIRQRKFDLIFVDGDHFELGIFNDLFLCHELRSPWVLLDDVDYAPVDMVTHLFVDNGFYVPVKHYSYRHEESSKIPKQALLLLLQN